MMILQFTYALIYNYHTCTLNIARHQFKSKQKKKRKLRIKNNCPYNLPQCLMIFCLKVKATRQVKQKKNKLI